MQCSSRLRSRTSSSRHVATCTPPVSQARCTTLTRRALRHIPTAAASTREASAISAPNLNFALTAASSLLVWSCSASAAELQTIATPQQAGLQHFSSVTYAYAQTVEGQVTSKDQLDLGTGCCGKQSYLALQGIISTADNLSAAAEDLVLIKTGDSSLCIAEVARRMSQQALALASEAVQLLTIDLPEAERHLVEQISEAARLVSLIADGIVAQETERGNISAN